MEQEWILTSGSKAFFCFFVVMVMFRQLYYNMMFWAIANSTWFAMTTLNPKHCISFCEAFMELQEWRQKAKQQARVNWWKRCKYSGNLSGWERFTSVKLQFVPTVMAKAVAVPYLIILYPAVSRRFFWLTFRCNKSRSCKKVSRILAILAHPEKNGRTWANMERWNIWFGKRWKFCQD